MSKSSAKTAGSARKGGSASPQKAAPAASAKSAPKGAPAQKTGRRKG
jgi:hypothetical protein